MSTKLQAAIHVKVTFPISKRGPFSERYPPETTVQTVRDGAMNHFMVADNAEFTYALTHAGQPQDPGTTLGEIVDDEKQATFRLVKRITQG